MRGRGTKPPDRIRASQYSDAVSRFVCADPTRVAAKSSAFPTSFQRGFHAPCTRFQRRFHAAGRTRENAPGELSRRNQDRPSAKSHLIACYTSCHLGSPHVSLIGAAMNAASHVESPISGRKLCAFALAAALALMAGAQFAPAHYAWAEDEPAATAQADATLPDAAHSRKPRPRWQPGAHRECAAPRPEDGSILLKDSGSNLQYSQDNEATWTSYSGNVTIGGTAGSGTNVQVLNGTHTILLNGVTINEPRRQSRRRIEIGSDTQAAQLTLWLYGSNKLSGSSGYPAIFAPGKAHLIFKGDLYGSLEAQGGYEAPAIGADSAVSSCGTIEFWQPGNVTARSGNGAPASRPDLERCGCNGGRCLSFRER